MNATPWHGLRASQGHRSDGVQDCLRNGGRFGRRASSLLNVAVVSPKTSRPVNCTGSRPPSVCRGCWRRLRDSFPVRQRKGAVLLLPYTRRIRRRCSLPTACYPAAVPPRTSPARRQRHQLHRGRRRGEWKSAFALICRWRSVPAFAVRDTGLHCAGRPGSNLSGPSPRPTPPWRGGWRHGSGAFDLHDLVVDGRVYGGSRASWAGDHVASFHLGLPLAEELPRRVRRRRSRFPAAPAPNSAYSWRKASRRTRSWPPTSCRIGAIYCVEIAGDGEAAIYWPGRPVTTRSSWTCKCRHRAVWKPRSLSQTRRRPLAADADHRHDGPRHEGRPRAGRG